MEEFYKLVNPFSTVDIDILIKDKEKALKIAEKIGVRDEVKKEITKIDEHVKMGYLASESLFSAYRNIRNATKRHLIRKGYTEKEENYSRGEKILEEKLMEMDNVLSGREWGRVRV